MTQLPCKKCGEPSTHVWRCDAHYSCDLCGANPPVKPFFADGGLWCGEECWQKHVAEIIKRNQRHPKDTERQALAVCPWCGYAENDSWEMSEGTHQCGRCEKEYEVGIEVIREYTTSKIVPSNNSLNQTAGAAAENINQSNPAAG